MATKPQKAALRHERVGIDTCCNDPDNGNFAGRVVGIQLQDGLLELEARLYPDDGPTLVELGSGRIRLAGKVWPTIGGISWYGNWCWDRFWFDRPVAVEFLFWLRGRRLFSAGCGEERLFNWWNGRWSPHGDERAFVDKQLAKAFSAEHGA